MVHARDKTGKYFRTAFLSVFSIIFHQDCCLFTKRKRPNFFMYGAKNYLLTLPNR